MMSSFVSQEHDAESGSHPSAAVSSNPVLLSSATFRTFSPSRRLFCLLAAFDFLATLFIWILYAHALSGQAFKDALKKEVVNYNFETSLFDIVLLALWRMIILLLAYALFISRKWYAVAATTAITTGFLLIKVVLMQFGSPDGDATLYYLLVLSSLILSWVESWVLDVKVIPTEIKVEQRVLQEERRSLLSDERRGPFTPYSLVSDHSFYTPEASDSEIESDREDHEHLAARRLSQQDQEYIQKGKETMEKTWELMGLNDGWKSEKVKDGIIVESRVIPSGKKIYRLKASLDAKAEDVFNLVVMHPEDAPKWGGNVTYSCVVRQIDDLTDIVYNSTGEAGGGMVASRDFVNLRRWEKRGDVFVSCNVAVECEEMPPKKEHIRATNGPGGWAIREAEGNPNRTEYVWLFDVDLKGWLPQSVIDAAMSFMLYQTGQGLKSYIREHLG
ncbi:StAR- lipid transfer protein 3 [Desmophyllum pertusum]|uniref:StAR- lipid transfer protein 3 n=1 Tax=Desmophyllum pertusum TaxID=174260 RepID=A0A9X0CRY3_9CNID|nr:StAR- lipid transfer protein 3 [Desmophyllum pertusum]